MKLLFSVFFISAFVFAKAQKIEKYFDYQWKETEPNSARFYAIIVKTDSGWHRQDYFIHEQKLQMDGIYEDDECKVANGLFRYYNSNGNLQSAGIYKHGKKQGVWISYYPNMMMSDSVNYNDGNPIGLKFSWHDNGIMSDSMQVAPDGSGVQVTWFDNGNPASAGRYGAGMKQNGKWQYFHKNGKLSALETYKDGLLTDKHYFDEEGNQMSDTTNKDEKATFIGGMNAWQKYLYKHIYFPSRFKIINADKAVVVVDGTIDEEGNITDINVSTPFYPEFDAIAVDAMKKSPKWIPAIQHNRKVKYRVRQAVFFSQE